jgi:hypothetical protein
MDYCNLCKFIDLETRRIAAVDWKGNQLRSVQDSAKSHKVSSLTLSYVFIRFFSSAYNDKMGSAIPMDRGDQFRHVRDVLSLTGNAKHDPRKERRYRIYYAKVLVIECRFCINITNLQMPVRVDELDRRKEMKLQWMDAKLAITVGGGIC